MSGYSVSFGNVFNPFVTGAVASALPTYSNFDSNSRLHITKYTTAMFNVKNLNINADKVHLKGAIICGDGSEGYIGTVIEGHLKNRVEQYSHSNSFSMNPGAMAAFCMSPNLMTAAMAMPVDRKSTSSSVHENHAKSGMYVKENHIEIGEKIEIKPELGNHEHLKVRDTAPISSIGSIMTGVQEIKENWEAIREQHHNDIIIDTEPVDVIQEYKEKTVIAVDADPKTPEKQAVKEPDYTIHEADTRELLDEIYDTDIAQHQEFDRGGSPDRIETELTKAIAGVIDHASELEKHVNCYTKAVFQVVGYVSDAFSAPLKPVNEYVISPALEAFGTGIRRTLRDDCRLSQGFAQDAGDMSSIVAGLLIPCRISKLPGKITKLKVPDRVTQRKVGNVGKYGELTRNVDSRGFFDGKQAHHIPSKKFMEKYGVKEKDGLSIIMTKEQHKLTRTHGPKAVVNIPSDATAREELARDLCDVRKIMKQDGTYTSDVNKKLLDGVDKFKAELPNVFKKEKK